MNVLENEKKDEEMFKKGYEYKVCSNMPEFKSIYYKKKQDALKKQDELLELWKMINVFVLIINLKEKEIIEYE